MRNLITWLCLTAAATATAAPVASRDGRSWRDSGVSACAGRGGRYARITFTDASVSSLAALLRAAPSDGEGYDIAYAPGAESARVTLSLEDVTLGEAARRFAVELGDCALVNATARRVTLRDGLDCPVRIVLAEGPMLPGDDVAPSELLDNGDGTLGMAKTADGRVWLSVVDVPLRIALGTVAKASGRALEIAPALRDLRVSVEARDMTWRDLLAAVLPEVGAVQRDSDGTIRIVPDPLHEPAFLGDVPMGE